MSVPAFPLLHVYIAPKVGGHLESSGVTVYLAGIVNIKLFPLGSSSRYSSAIIVSLDIDFAVMYLPVAK